MVYTIFTERCNLLLVRIAVAPYAGAWIEMLKRNLVVYYHNVAPYAGAWIEITKHNSVYGQL